MNGIKEQEMTGKERHKEDSLIFLGGMNKWLVDGKSFSRNFRTGERLYSTQGIGACISANGGGLAGSGGGLYLVRRKNGREKDI